jgi:hypothetical protein
MYRLRRRPPHPVSPPGTVAVAEVLDPTTQRILVVEDNDCLRAVAVRPLPDISGFKAHRGDPPEF